MALWTTGSKKDVPAGSAWSEPSDGDGSSLHERILGLVLRPTAPPTRWGVLVAVALISGEIVLVQQLRRIAPDMAFGALFLFGVLMVSAGWGFPLAFATSLASACAYVYFHSADDADALVPAVIVFLVLSIATTVLVGQARLRAREAEERRREADLAADLARLVLRAVDLPAALTAAGHRITRALALPAPGAVLLVADDPGPDLTGREAIGLHDGTNSVGTLLVPSLLTAEQAGRVRRILPSLRALLSAAREHDRLNAALRSSRRELERFFALTTELLCIGDADGIGRTNPAFEEVLGYDLDRLRSTPLRELFHPEDRARTEDLLDRVLARDATVTFEVRCLRSDGVQRWLEWSMVGDQGTLFATARDVTDRRREQNRLWEAQQQLERSHTRVSALARQQTALRRVATLVAQRPDPDEVYPVAVAELAASLDIEHVSLVRYEEPEHCVVVAAHDGTASDGALAVGERLQLGGDNISTLVYRTGLPARIESYPDTDTPVARRLRRVGMRSGMGVPITVDDRVWGALVVGSDRRETMNFDNQAHTVDYADLIATAIYNHETRAALTASRARIVAAADQARRTIERDLHDGVQQRIVALGLGLRATQSAIPPDHGDLRGQLSDHVDSLSQLYTDLQELSRGIHPAILSRGGLGPALKTLARRSSVPVRLELSVTGRLPESVEVAAYYVVAESLTNTAKYARAEEILLRAESANGYLELRVSDDGAGGARIGAGSGLLGLQDRVEALDGTLELTSPSGAGTTITARIPIPR
ncbi:PAS domain-containing protein [Nocardia sp. NPDC055321]